MTARSETAELVRLQEVNRKLLLKLEEQEHVNDHLWQLLEQSRETTQSLRVGLSRAVTTIADFEEHQQETNKCCAQLKTALEEKMVTTDHN